MNYSEQIKITEEFNKLISLDTQMLEKLAHEDQSYALRTKNLKTRYESFNRAKKIFKIIQLVNELAEKQKEHENEQ